VAPQRKAVKPQHSGAALSVQKIVPPGCGTGQKPYMKVA
jgi:hypothetical protein